MITDSNLLASYARDRSEAAFAELVRRHLPLVYGTALRLTGGRRDLAEDVSQSVWVDLARKAGQLSRHPAPVGWLYTAVHLAAGKMVRGEARRLRRETEAMTMSDIHRTEHLGGAETGLGTLAEDLIVKLDWRRTRSAAGGLRPSWARVRRENARPNCFGNGS